LCSLGEEETRAAADDTASSAGWRSGACSSASPTRAAKTSCVPRPQSRACVADLVRTACRAPSAAPGCRMSLGAILYFYPAHTHGTYPASSCPSAVLNRGHFHALTFRCRAPLHGPPVSAPQRPGAARSIRSRPHDSGWSSCAAASCRSPRPLSAGTLESRDRRL
jgi:hypothetical protein